jgi:hypothetical protein
MCAQRALNIETCHCSPSFVALTLKRRIVRSRKALQAWEESYRLRTRAVSLREGPQT